MAILICLVIVFQALSGFAQERIVVSWDAFSNGASLRADSEENAITSTVGQAYASTKSKAENAIVSGGFLFGAVQPVSAVEESAVNEKAYEYKLEQNYPNPFNPSTTISFSLAEHARVTMKVYDILGRQVRTLVNETMKAGNHQVVFNAAGLASGIYFYRITAGNTFVKVRKLMILK